MNHKFLHFFSTIFLALLTVTTSATAKEKGPGSAAPEGLAIPVLQDIADSYAPWSEAEFSGKLHSDRLPISPTVKIFMVRDSLIQISLRAPLVGEVGRVEFTPQRFVAVNKMKRVFAEEDSPSLLESYPGALADMQSLLLARVVLAGKSELGPDNFSLFSVTDAGSGNWMLTPAEMPSGNEMGFNYGYIVGNSGRTLAMIASVHSQFEMLVTYGYRNRGLQLDVQLDQANGRKTDFDLNFETVRWGGKPMTPLSVRGYSKVGIKDFIASIG